MADPVKQAMYDELKRRGAFRDPAIAARARKLVEGGHVVDFVPDSGTSAHDPFGDPADVPSHGPSPGSRRMTLDDFPAAISHTSAPVSPAAGRGVAVSHAPVSHSPSARARPEVPFGLNDKYLLDPAQNQGGVHSGQIVSGIGHFLRKVGKDATPLAQPFGLDPFKLGYDGESNADKSFDLMGDAMTLHPAVGTALMLKPLAEAGGAPLHDAFRAYQAGDHAKALSLLKSAPGAVGEYARQNKLETAMALLPLAHAGALGASGSLLAKAGTLERLGAEAGTPEAAAHLTRQAATLRRFAQPVHDVATLKPITHTLKSVLGKSAKAVQKGAQAVQGNTSRYVAKGRALTENTGAASLADTNEAPPVQTPPTTQAAPLLPSATAQSPHPLLETASPMTPGMTKPPGSVDPGTRLIPNFPVDQMRLDPERFQYKIGAGRGGQTGSLSDAPAFNQDLAGVVHLWHDPADGGDYVVNGHNRHALATRAGEKGMDARFLDAKTAEEARTQGAMINIAEGQGTALDAAKLFRDQDMTPDKLAAQGISIKGEKASQGMALSKLSPPLFAQVVRGELPVERAALIGEKLPEHGDQMTLVSQVDKAQRSGKQLTNGQIGEMADAVAAGPRITTTETNLFGEESTTRSTAAERGEVADYLRTQMAQEGGIFKNAAKNAVRLTKGNNVIDAARSQEIALLNDQGSELFKRLKNAPGPISDILNKAAARLARGENPNAVKQDALTEFQSAVPELVKSGGSAGEAGNAGGVGSTGQPGSGGDLFAGPEEGPLGGGATGSDGGTVHPQPEEVAPALFEGKGAPAGDAASKSPSPYNAQSDPGQPDSSVPGSSTDAAPSTEAGGFSSPAPQRDGITLQASILPGADKFVEQDVIPSVKAAAKGVAETVREIRQSISPASMSPEAGQTARIVRENAAGLAMKRERSVMALKALGKAFEKSPPADNYAFIHTMETGGIQKTPELQAAAKVLRDALDERRAQVQALGTGKLDNFIANYFPHLWEDPKKAGGIFGQIFGKRPLEGSKSFLKKRTLPTLADGLAAGLKPVTDNPVELSLLKMHEMDRFVMGQSILSEMKDSKIAKFVKATEKPPEGHAKIDDKIATIHGPLTDEGAVTIRGYYFAPEAAARVLNNYLSPGLRGHAWYQGLQYGGNVLNQAQLGFSAFHLGFTAMDSATSKFALGVEQLSRGEVGRGALNVGKAVLPGYAPITNILRGDKVLKEYLKPGTMGADIAAIADSVVAGGGRVKMDDIYRTGAAGNFWKALRTGNYPGAALRAVPALIEKLSAPIMEEIVPRMKLGVFADLAKVEMERLPATATRDDVRAAMSRAWDSVDNRMGQVVYDNLFWEKSLKDVLMVSTRSLGWNLGTWRELGGGVTDITGMRSRRRAGDPVVTHRMAYIVALPAMTALYGALYQYMATGQGPTELKDYFFPRTGHTRPDGHPERVQLPSYMKDLHALYKNPGKTITDKANPQISMIADMMGNRDFYGTEIRNADDPLVQQVGETLAFAGKQFLPFSVTGAMKRKESGASLGQQAQPFFGILPAPGDVDRTRAEQMISDDLQKMAPQGAKTQARADKTQAERGLRSRARQGEDVRPTLREMVQGGQMTGRGAKQLLGQARKSPNEAALARLSLPDAYNVWRAATPEEKAKWLVPMRRKLQGAADSNSLSLAQVGEARDLGIIPRN
jgi:hypothetical protein